MNAPLMVCIADQLLDKYSSRLNYTCNYLRHVLQDLKNPWRYRKEAKGSLEPLLRNTSLKELVIKVTILSLHAFIRIYYISKDNFPFKIKNDTGPIKNLGCLLRNKKHILSVIGQQITIQLELLRLNNVLN